MCLVSKFSRIFFNYAISSSFSFITQIPRYIISSVIFSSSSRITFFFYFWASHWKVHIVNFHFQSFPIFHPNPWAKTSCVWLVIEMTNSFYVYSSESKHKLSRRFWWPEKKNKFLSAIFEILRNYSARKTCEKRNKIKFCHPLTPPHVFCQRIFLFHYFPFFLVFHF